MNYEDRVTKEYIEDALAAAGGAKIAYGTYTGDSTNGRKFVLGFAPKLVIFSGLWEDPAGNDDNGLTFVFAGARLSIRDGGNFTLGSSITLNEDGFTLNSYKYHNLYSRAEHFIAIG